MTPETFQMLDVWQSSRDGYFLKAFSDSTCLPRDACDATRSFELDILLLIHTNLDKTYMFRYIIVQGKQRRKRGKAQHSEKIILLESVLQIDKPVKK